MASKVRLFVDHPLGEGQSVPLSRDQSLYLFSVMRLSVGTVLSLINGRDGEWDATVAQAGKKNGVVVCQAQTAPLTLPPDLTLLFAPVRKDRTAMIVEKAVELGVRRIVPVQTDFTNGADRLRQDKMQAQVTEAAEQCGATYVPDVAALTALGDVLDDWDASRQLVFCDETLTGRSSSLAGRLATSGAILIGPEGGFSDKERMRLRDMDAAVSISLGPRILRAETAAIAALTLWQHHVGDWQ
ncbi:16S rRNA (uracil(1498)-N(3))-methyltransferase [Yoonia sp. 208BN28-4]|uniref:16S rRNA (uracil(1498)-N(3))-methyltransferase n=1 Tax=Yoonia sp. 208BN28-4 TaxID=3126505 RepID=UPI00309D12FF